jgi:predicted RNA methylase
MGTGSKIALGCGCLFIAGALAAVGACGLLGYWAKGKAAGVVDDFDRMAKKATAVTDEIDRWERKANANPYTPPPDGVIAERRLVTFLEVRKQVHAVYEAHKADIEALAKKSESPSDKVSVTDLWNAGGRLADTFGALKLAQAKALAEAGMSEHEYHDIQIAVYKSAWVSESERRTGETPAEALDKSMTEAGRQVEDAMARGVAEAQKHQVPGADQLSPEDAMRLGSELTEARKAARALEVPKANVELFRKHEAEIRQYAMSGLGLLGL